MAQLAQAVQQAPRSLSGADVAAQLLSDGLDEVVHRLKTQVRQALAQALDLPATQPASGQSDGYSVAAKRGMLVVATAMLFHHRVQDHLPVECPAGFDGDWPPASATACAEQETAINAYREAWRAILAVDYRPVFETGRAALAALPADPDTGQAIRHLGEVVTRVSERGERSATRPAGAHLSPGAGHRALRRLLLHLHRGRGSAGIPGHPRTGRRLVRPQLRCIAANLRSCLRHRNVVDGRGRAHPRPAERRRPYRTGRRGGPGPAVGRGRAMGATTST